MSTSGLERGGKAMPRSGPAGQRPAATALRALWSAVPAVLFGTLGIAVILMAWWVLAGKLGPLRLPSPWVVFAAIRTNWRSIPAMQYIAMQSGGLRDALAFTVASVLLTVAAGAVSGTAVGIAMPHATVLRLGMMPVLVVLGSTPLLILLPFLVQWFGAGRFVRSGIVIIFTFVVMATVCVRSSRQAIGNYGDYARSLGARPGFEMWHVVLPALTPDLLAGLRVSLSAAWSLQAVAEIIGGQNGSGRIISTMAHLANTAVILAMVVCLCVTAVVIDGLLTLVAGRTVTWRA